MNDVSLPKTKISQSQLGAYQRCPRLYLYRYIDKLESHPSHSMGEGTLVHQGLAELYRAMRGNYLVPDAAHALQDALLTMRHIREKGYHYKGELQPPPAIEDTDFERLQSLMAYYAQHYYDNDHDEFEPIMIEETHEVEVGGITYEFTIDLAAKLKRVNVILVMDHKTISQTPRASASALQIDTQFLLYEACARQLFAKDYPNTGFEIVRNLIRRDVPPGFGSRPATTASGRKSTASTDSGDYLRREHFSRSPRELRTALAGFKTITGLAYADRPREEYYRTVINSGGEACSNCTYFVRCAGDLLAGNP